MFVNKVQCTTMAENTSVC